MSWTRPTRASLLSEIQTDLATALPTTSPWLPRSILRAVAAVQAGASDILYGILDYVVRQIFAHSADDAYVLRHAEEYGITRTAATAAKWSFTFTGTPTTSIPAGTVVTRVDGWRFETDSIATVGGGGTVAVAVTALDTGADGNSSGDVELASPIAGITAVAMTSLTTSGADLETIAELRARVLARKRTPPQGGAEADYVAWASEVSGVAKVWVEPAYLGAGTVGVYFVVDGTGSDIIPDSGEVAAVQASIESVDSAGLSTRRPVTAAATAVAPSEVSTNVTISGITASFEAAVEVALEAVFLEYAGESIPWSAFWAAVAGAAPGDDFDITAPAASVGITSGQCATLGTLSFV